MRRVEGWGNPASRLVVIGEAPAEREEQAGQPFVGPAGYRLTEWMGRAGLRRQDAFIDNVYQYRPTANKIDSVDRATLEQWMGYLHERLAALPDPWLIVPTGNYALYALTGKGKVHWHLRDGKEVRPGILDWRGSILEYTDLNGRRIKCIPTIHPAATFHQPTLERVCLRDWERIASELAFRDVRRPTREHDVRPSLAKLESFYLETTTTPDAVLAIDIENPRTTKSAPLLADDGTPTVYKSGKREGHPKTKKVAGEAKIVCVGFSLTPDHSLTVSVEPSYWGSDDRLTECWSWIKRLCESPVQKVLHNGLYDAFFLLDHHISLSNWRWDTLFMHHALDPSADHDLASCASVDTREPFWKHMAKDPEESARYYSNFQAYLIYNGIDCCVTRELFDVYYNRLQSEVRGRGTGLEFYLNHYADLYQPLLSLTRHGIAVDDVKRKTRLQQLHDECSTTWAQAKLLTGVDLYGKKSLSPKKLQQYLYETLHLSKQYRRRKALGPGVKTLTVDEVAVRRLMAKYPTCEPLQQVGPLILEHRRKSTLSTFYRTERIDTDGRFRSGYSLNTEAGRLSSSRNPRGTGSNAQNVDREARDIFLADDGRIGLEADASQAEARIDYLLLYHLTKDRALLDKARLRPHEYDQHTENAAVIFNIPTAQVTKEQRYVGKKAVHAAFRDMQGEKLADEMLKEGRVYTAEECDKLILAFRRRLGDGYIEELFRWVRRRILKDYYLENTWGRRLYFKYDRLDDEAYRRGYSFDPQCCDEETEVLTLDGFVPFHDLTTRHFIAAWDQKDGNIIFEQPLRALSYPYTGSLVSFEGMRASLAVTKNHRQPCDPVKVGRARGTWKVKTADTISTEAEVEVPSCGRRVGGVHLPRSVVQLLVATQADGTLRHTHAAVEWHFSKYHKIARLLRLLRRAGLRPTECSNTDGTVTISAGPAWYAAAMEWLGPRKSFSARFLTLDVQSLQVFVRELGRWDSQRTTGCFPSMTYVNTDEKSADIAQAAAVLCGYRAFKCRRDNIWAVNMTRKRITSTIAKAGFGLLDYSGLVYCLTCSTGFFVVRRHGKVCITGNSEVADLMNQRGLKPLWQRRGGGFDLNAHGHDSLFLSVQPDLAYDLAKFLVDSLEQPRTYYGIDLSMPCTVKLGRSWKTTVEFLQLPERHVFEAAIKVVLEG